MKPKYEKPQVIDLNVPKVWGATCGFGGDPAPGWGTCATGPKPNATSQCQNGGSNTGSQCRSGGSASQGCQTGSIA